MDPQRNDSSHLIQSLKERLEAAKHLIETGTNIVTDVSHGTASSKGWHDDALTVEEFQHAFQHDDVASQHRVADYIAGKLLMIVDEVLEATDHVRKPPPNVDTPEGFEAWRRLVINEIADVVIRAGDFAGWIKGNLGEAVTEKLAINFDRPFRHGRKLL